MITKDHELSISAQARLLNISRSTTYYTPRPPSAQDLTLMRQLDELHFGVAPIRPVIVPLLLPE